MTDTVVLVVAIPRCESFSAAALDPGVLALSSAAVDDSRAKLLLPGRLRLVGMRCGVAGDPVAEFGLGSAVVQHRDLSARTESRLAGVALFIAAALACAVTASAPAVASFYSQDALLLVLPALSGRFVLDAFATVPRAVLARDLRFKQLALIEAVEATIMAGTGLLVAYATRSMGLNRRKLDGGLRSPSANIIVPIMPRWPGRLGDLRPLPRLARRVLSRLAWFRFDADFVLVGRMLGRKRSAIHGGVELASARRRSSRGVLRSPRDLRTRNRTPGSAAACSSSWSGVALVIFPLPSAGAGRRPLVMIALGPKWVSPSVPPVPVARVHPSVLAT